MGIRGGKHAVEWRSFFTSSRNQGVHAVIVLETFRIQRMYSSIDSQGDSATTIVLNSKTPIPYTGKTKWTQNTGIEPDILNSTASIDMCISVEDRNTSSTLFHFLTGKSQYAVVYRDDIEGFKIIDKTYLSHMERFRDILRWRSHPEPGKCFFLVAQNRIFEPIFQKCVE